MSTGPESGYYVSRHPDIPVREGGSKEAIDQSGMTTEAVVRKHYEDTRKDALAAPKPKGSTDVYQGAWPEGGKTYLDVSDQYSNIMDAAREAIKNRQLSIYSASAKDEGDKYIPVWNEGRTKHASEPNIVATETKRLIRDLGR
jgi:hypothetical protein